MIACNIDIYILVKVGIQQIIEIDFESFHNQWTQALMILKSSFSFCAKRAI